MDCLYLLHLIFFMYRNSIVFLVIVILLSFTQFFCLENSIEGSVSSVTTICGEVVQLPLKRDSLSCFVGMLPSSLISLEKELVNLEKEMSNYPSFAKVINTPSIEKEISELSKEDFYLPIAKYLRYKADVLSYAGESDAVALSLLIEAETLIKKHIKNRCDSIELTEIYSWQSYYQPTLAKKIECTEKAISLNRRTQRIKELALELSNLSGFYKNVKSSNKADSLVGKAACIWQEIGYDENDPRDLLKYYHSVNAQATLYQRKGIEHYRRREFGQAQFYFSKTLVTSFDLLEILNKDTLLPSRYKHLEILPKILTNIGRTYITADLGFLLPDNERLFISVLERIEQEGVQTNKNKLLLYPILAYIEAQKTNFTKAKAWIEKAIVAGMNGKYKQQLNNLHPNMVVDNQGFIESMYVKALIYEKNYTQSKDVRHLEQAVKILQNAISYLKKVLKEEASENPSESLLEVYHLYHAAASSVALQLYELTTNQTYLELALNFSDEGKSNNLLQTLDKKLSKRSNKHQNLSLPSIEAIRKNWLNNQTAIIEYEIGQRSSHAFVITENKIKVIPIAMDSLFYQHIEEYANTLQDSLAYFAAQSYQLYEKIFAPIEAEIETEIKDLVIIADGNMNEIIFQSLITKPSKETRPTKVNYKTLDYLVKDYNISYLPSLSVYQRLRELKKIKEQPPSVLGSFIANPARWNMNPSNLKPIPEVDAITRKIADYETIQNKIYPNATKNDFLSKANQFSYLLLTMHGFLNNISDPTSGYIAFTPSTEDNGQLSFQEIAKVPLNADLIFLANCNSGQGDNTTSEGIVSLSRAFMEAGCQGSIATMKNVKEYNTAKIVEKFYKYLLEEEQSITYALSQAQRDYISTTTENPHPSSWVNYIYTGVDALDY